MLPASSCVLNTHPAAAAPPARRLCGVRRHRPAAQLHGEPCFRVPGKPHVCSMLDAALPEQGMLQHPFSAACAAPSIRRSTGLPIIRRRPCSFSGPPSLRPSTRWATSCRCAGRGAEGKVAGSMEAGVEEPLGRVSQHGCAHGSLSSCCLLLPSPTLLQHHVPHVSPRVLEVQPR